MESKLLSLKKKLYGKKDSKESLDLNNDDHISVSFKSKEPDMLDSRPSFEQYEAEIKKRTLEPQDNPDGSQNQKDYWAEEGSKLFQRWTPTKADPEENKQMSTLLSKVFWKKPSKAAPTPSEPPQEKEPPMLFDPNYKFLHLDTPENLILGDIESKDGIPLIKGGTLAKLVERLTYDKYVDTNYLQQFLLTYRTFTTPEEFFSLLIERYNVSDPISATPGQLKKFSTLKKVVRLRVFNVLKTWADKHYYDFDNDKNLVQQLLTFCDTLNQTGMEKSATFLRDFVSRKRSEDGDKQKSDQVSPLPNVSQGISSTLELSKLNALEVARQMTLIEFDIYRAILPSEFNNQAWAKGSRDEKERNSPNVITMIDRFNQVSNWVATTILFEEDLISRRDLLVYFIHLANFCKELHNYNGMMEVIAGVTSTSTYRLKKTWSLVDRNTMTIFEELNTLLSRDNNFANFRKSLHNVQPPALPYLGVYLTDMIFVDQGNPDFINGTNLINFHKRRLLSFVIREIQQYQQLPYTYKRVDFIADYLLSLKYKSEEECYSQSLKIEPREESSKQVAERKNLPPGYDPPDEFEFDFPIDFPFKEDDSEENILFLPYDETRQKFLIKSGTLEKLVERLTYPRYPDPEYLSIFLMTYRSFCTPKQLLDLLIHRFNTPLPKNCLEEDLKRFKESRRTPIRLRVANVFKNWIDKYFNDFLEDRSLIVSFLQFLKSYNDTDQAIDKALEQLKKSMQRRLKEQLEDNDEMAVVDFIDTLPDIREDTYNLYSAQPAEFAQQLSVVHKRMYLTVDVVKLLKSNYDYARDCGPGGNLSMLVTFNFKDADGSGNIVILDLFSKEIIVFYEHLEKIIYWVQKSLLGARSTSERIDIITKFIEMAETSRQIYSFHAMAAIVIGLTSNISKSFKKAWSSYPSKPHLSLLNDLQLLIERSEDNGPLPYVKNLKQSSGMPAVPFFVPYLEKLTKISMEPKDVNNQINFDKRRKVSDILHEILVYQKKNYEWNENHIAQKFLLCLPKREMNEDDMLAAAISANESDESLKEDLSLQTYTLMKLGRKQSADVILTQQQDNFNRSHSSQSLSSQEQMDPEAEKLAQLTRESIQKIKKEIKEEIISIMNSWRQMDLLTKSETEKDVIRGCFPNIVTEEWEEDDKDGFVYGQPSPVKLFLHRLSDKTILVRFLPNVINDDIETIVKERKFYCQREPDNPVEETVLIVPRYSVNESFKQLADANSIILYDP